MAATSSVEAHNRAHVVFSRLNNSATSKKPQRLSPLWEAYILGILQPSYRIDLRNDETASAYSRPTARIALMQKFINFHPFNFSDSEVNFDRGRSLLAYLGNVLTGADTHSPRWWPQDVGSFVEAVKKEREEIDTLGYMKGEKQR